tara:strand:+ start:312 stop:1010 length:699 start_codon:yes stop_codon:yes gene_type:complete
VEIENNPKEKELFQIVNINPEPIGLFTIPTEKHLGFKKIINSIFNNAPDSLKQKFDSEPYTQHICNTSEQNIFISFPELSELKSYFERYLITYIKTIGHKCNEVLISSAWLNKANKDSILNYHLHTNSYISANYFVDYDPNIHSPLSFRNDRVSTNSIPTFPLLDVSLDKNRTIYTADKLDILAKEGQIIVWRSHNPHGYLSPNKGDNRITLSLNSFPKVLDNGRYRVTISP